MPRDESIGLSCWDDHFVPTLNGPSKGSQQDEGGSHQTVFPMIE